MITPKLQDLLDQHRTIYKHHTHRPTYTAKDLARADNTPPWEVAKTVVFVGDGAYGMAVLPSNTKVDLSTLRRVLGLTTARLASEDELAELFPDTELGAMPPFGNLYNNIPVYVDRELAEDEEIAFNAGTHRDVVHLSFRDFRHLAHPTIVSFSMPS